MDKKTDPDFNQDTQVSVDSFRFNGQLLIFDSHKPTLELAGNILDELKISHQLFNSIDLLVSADWNNDISLVFIDIQFLTEATISFLIEQKINNSGLRIIGLKTNVSRETEHSTSQNILTDEESKHNNREEFLYLLNRYSSPFNLTPLKSLIDDPIDLSLIIQQFKSETQNDLDQLKIHLDKYQTEKILHHVHRLAGRISQFGGLQFSQSLKAIEKEGVQDKTLSEKTKTHLKYLIESIQNALRTI